MVGVGRFLVGLSGHHSFRSVEGLPILASPISFLCFEAISEAIMCMFSSLGHMFVRKQRIYSLEKTHDQNKVMREA